jgi:hypothetical protein
MTPPPRPDDPLCAFCGIAVPTMEAIVYHGIVYHPACVAPTTRRAVQDHPPDDASHPARRPSS